MVLRMSWKNCAMAENRPWNTCRIAANMPWIVSTIAWERWDIPDAMPIFAVFFSFEFLLWGFYDCVILFWVSGLRRRVVFDTGS